MTYTNDQEFDLLMLRWQIESRLIELKIEPRLRAQILKGLTAIQHPQRLELLLNTLHAGSHSPARRGAPSRSKAVKRTVER